MLNYYIVDLETTGLSSKIHETIEISIIRFKDKFQLTEFIRAEHPMNASLDSLMLLGKSIEDLSYGKSKEEVVQKIDEFLLADGLTPDHRCFIAHNYNFDKKFIHALYDKVGKTLPVNLWACSMALSKHYAKNVLGIPKPKVNLDASLELVGIKKTGKAHTAKSDTRNTYFLWKELTENKKIDHLPFIKTAPHQSIILPNEEDDMSLLDDV